MGEVNETSKDGDDHHHLTEEEIISMYETLRAAERDPSLSVPFSGQSMKVNIDWDVLEKRALRPSLPEHFRRPFEVMPIRVIAYSIVGPVFGFIATFFALRDAPVALTRSFFLTVIGAASVLVLLFMWAAVAMQAMQRLHEHPVPGVARAPQPVPAGPISVPSYRLGSRRPALAFFGTVALIVTLYLVIARPGREATESGPPTASAPAEELDEDVVFEVQDTTGGPGDNGVVPAHKNDPAGERKPAIYLTKAEALYQKLMLLSVSDPEAAAQRDRLADQALEQLNLAAKADPGHATIWTRRAEIYVLKGDLEMAKESLAKIKDLENVPPLEERRAHMILAVIDAREISTRFRNTPRQELAERLDKTIQDVETTQATSTDASLLLAHLQNARAEVTEDAREKVEIEKRALSSSLATLRTPATGLRTVERPAALSRPAERVTSAQTENLVPTGTSPSPPN